MASPSTDNPTVAGSDQEQAASSAAPAKAEAAESQHIAPQSSHARPLFEEPAISTASAPAASVEKGEETEVKYKHW